MGYAARVGPSRLRGSRAPGSTLSPSGPNNMAAARQSCGPVMAQGTFLHVKRARATAFIESGQSSTPTEKGVCQAQGGKLAWRTKFNTLLVLAAYCQQVRWVSSANFKVNLVPGDNGLRIH